MNENDKIKECKTEQDKCYYVIENHDITSQEKFIKEYKKDFGEAVSQSWVSRRFTEWNITKKSQRRYYIKFKGTLSNEKEILNANIKRFITNGFTGKFKYFILNVQMGSEQTICNSIINAFNLEHTSLIPCFGSVLVIGYSKEVEELKEYFKQFDVSFDTLLNDKIEVGKPTITISAAKPKN